MTEIIPSSCLDLMHPQTSKCWKKAGPHFTEVREYGQQNRTASSPVWTHLLSQSHSTGLSLLIFPSTHIFVFQNSSTICTKASETQGTAKQQSHHPPSKELTKLKLSSAPKSTNKLILLSLFLQWFSVLAVNWPDYQPDSHKPAGSHGEKHHLSPWTWSWVQIQCLLWLYQA